MTGSLVFDYLHKFHESNRASVDTAVETQFIVEMIVYNRDLQSFENFFVNLQRNKPL